MRSFGPPSAHYRSPDFSTIRGERLTDRRIQHYMLRGHYGEAAQRRALLERALAKPKPRVKKPDTVSLALALLADM